MGIRNTANSIGGARNYVNRKCFFLIRSIIIIPLNSIGSVCLCLVVWKVSWVQVSSYLYTYIYIYIQFQCLSKRPFRNLDKTDEVIWVQRKNMSLFDIDRWLWKFITNVRSSGFSLYDNTYEYWFLSSKIYILLGRLLWIRYL